ncbi:hypothetical protein L1987_48769 [Smallanthus sonchifolius]|uniref:Uncharacterized protein n=1 Tax=Smallanthus sonchifolius TaxID=185202 RepID=A0ACB9FUI1_9ASTR|nr:hypothetical protein L1987_48769 [Smallanthus sonchifolius]
MIDDTWTPLAYVLLIHLYVRPTEPLKWWEGGKILGGRDVIAGGTWLASSREGRVAFVTNVRQAKQISPAKGRGDLVVRFLQSNKDPVEFAEEIVNEADQYRGFNLIIADVITMNMVYVTNGLKGDSCYMTIVAPGVHVLSNASLDTPWPKAKRLERGFRDLLDEYGVGEIPINKMVDKLMGNTIKDDINMLPHICDIELEYQLSSVFVNIVSAERPYGTRSTSTVVVKVNGEFFFYEKHMDNDIWKEHNETYTVVKSDK